MKPYVYGATIRSLTRPFLIDDDDRQAEWAAYRQRNAAARERYALDAATIDWRYDPNSRDHMPGQRQR